jgi:hypothetical protein
LITFTNAIFVHYVSVRASTGIISSFADLDDAVIVQKNLNKQADPGNGVHAILLVYRIGHKSSKDIK